MNKRLWTVDLFDDLAGRLSIVGLARTAAEAQKAACAVAKAEYQAKRPEITGLKAGDYVEFGLPK